MSKFKCNFHSTAKASVNWDFELDPSNYLECNTKDEVYAEIFEVDCDPDNGDWDFSEIEKEFTIDENFWAEWERLKSNPT